MLSAPTTLPSRPANKGWLLTATDESAQYITDISTYVVVWPGPVAKLRLLTASQQPVEGGAPGSAGNNNPGSPGSATAGVAFPVTVQAVDAYWNTNHGRGPQYTAEAGDNVYVLTNDAFVQNDATTTMNQGQRAFGSLTPRTAQSNWTLSAMDVDNPSISSQTVSGVNVAAASGGALHFQVILPGETAQPGSGQYPTGGKQNSPATQIAGQSISAVTVNLVDDFWNPIKSGPSLPYVSLSPASLPLDTYAVVPSSKQMTSGINGYQAIFASTLTLTTAGSALTHQLQAVDVSSPSVYNTENSSLFTVIPNSLATLQIIMPGELAAAGKPINWSFNGDPAGKTGQPSNSGAAFMAGSPFQVTVNATDSYFNVISTNPAVYLTSNDSYGAPNTTQSIAQTLVAGTTLYTVTLVTAQDATAVPITHHLISTGTTAGYQTPDFAMQANSNPTRLQILLPGETAVPGNTVTNGKTGTPNAAAAGDAYPVTVRVTDTWFNAVGNTSLSAQIHLITTDPFAPTDGDPTINAGASNFATTYGGHKFQEANPAGWTVFASTSGGPGYLSATAGPVVVTPDNSTGTIHTHQLIALLPGETLDPGDIAANGRIGTPNFTAVLGHTPPVAGDTFPITTIGTDRFFNRIFDSQNPSVLMGANAALYPTYSPSSGFTLNNGSTTITVSVQSTSTAASFNVTQVAPVQTYSYSSATTTLFAVNPGAAVKLQILIQGETAVPGSPTGKSGAPATPFTAGVIYHATVNATDILFNLVTTAAQQVKMTVTDPNSTQTNIQQNLINGSTVFALQFLTASGTGWTVHVSTAFGSALTDAQSVALPVVAAAPTKILVTVPGLFFNPGNVGAGGLSGSPNSETAGTTWLATATITDNYYNPVGNAGTGSLYFQTSDPYDVDGTTSTLSQGTTNFMVTMVTAGNQSLSIYPSTLNLSVFHEAPSPASRSSPPLWTTSSFSCRAKRRPRSSPTGLTGSPQRAVYRRPILRGHRPMRWTPSSTLFRPIPP